MIPVLQAGEVEGIVVEETVERPQAHDVGTVPSGESTFLFGINFAQSDHLPPSDTQPVMCRRKQGDWRRIGQNPPGGYQP